MWHRPSLREKDRGPKPTRIQILITVAAGDNETIEIVMVLPIGMEIEIANDTTANARMILVMLVLQEYET